MGEGPRKTNIQRPGVARICVITIEFVCGEFEGGRTTGDDLGRGWACTMKWRA